MATIIVLIAFIIWIGYRYRESQRTEREARRVLEFFYDFDGEDLDEAAADDRTVPAVEGQRVRYRVRNRRRIARAVADSAYLKFGPRPANPENVLITRKFMFDELSGYRDMRNRDKAGIIDWAVHFSFLPSQDYLEASRMSQTKAWQAAYGGVRPGWCRWIFHYITLGLINLHPTHH